MPTRLCHMKGCNQPATYRGRCPTHSRTHEQDTHPNRHIYNSKRWQLLRRRVLFNQPLCHCGHIATIVDHITPIQDGGQPYNTANLQPLCAHHHSIKTNQEVRSR